MTLVSAQEVKQAWYQMCEEATTKQELELLTIKLGKAAEFLIEKDGQWFYIMEQVTALIPLNKTSQTKKT